MLHQSHHNHFRNLAMIILLLRVDLLSLIRHLGLRHHFLELNHSDVQGRLSFLGLIIGQVHQIFHLLQGTLVINCQLSMLKI